MLSVTHSRKTGTQFFPTSLSGVPRASFILLYPPCSASGGLFPSPDASVQRTLDTGCINTQADGDPGLMMEARVEHLHRLPFQGKIADQLRAAIPMSLLSKDRDCPRDLHPCWSLPSSWKLPESFLPLCSRQHTADKAPLLPGESPSIFPGGSFQQVSTTGQVRTGWPGLWQQQSH